MNNSLDKLYPLPDGWEWRKLGDLCHLITKGSTPTTYGFKFVSSGINFIKIENIAKGKIQKQTIQSFITKEANQAQKRSILQENDILFSIAGTIGESCIVTKDDLPANTNQALAIIRLRETVEPNFIRLLLSSEVLDEIRNKQRGGALKNISLEDVKNADIPLPPLDGQKRIVEKLDGLFGKIDKAIGLLYDSIASASALLPSALNEVFGEIDGKYLKEKIEKFDKKMSAGGTPLRSKSEYWNGEIEWFSSGELNQLYTLPSNERITEVGLKNSSAKLLLKGTLLIGMYDTAAMKMSILHTNGSCNQAIVGIKPNEDELNIFFLKYQLEYLKPKILEERQGVRQQNLNLSKIKNIEIEYPPLDIQAQTVEHLDAVRGKSERLTAKLKTQREELVALKASLLERAFKGEL